MLNSKSKKNQNQGITSNNKSSRDSGSSKPSGDKDKSKKDKDTGNKDKEKDKSKDKDQTKDKTKEKTKSESNKPKPKDQETDKSKGNTGDNPKDSSSSESNSKKDKDDTEGTGNVSSYPTRTSEATAEAQNVVDELKNILGDGRRAPNPAVSVITHKDGTVSVGFSGEASPKNIETARQLQNALNKKYGDKYTVKAEPMPTEKLKIVKGGNDVGTCAESKVVNAAHNNPSEITGMDTVWRSSKKENPYPYAEDSNQMNPCLTCSHNINIEEYMKYANANKK